MSTATALSPDVDKRQRSLDLVKRITNARFFSRGVYRLYCDLAAQDHAEQTSAGLRARGERVLNCATDVRLTEDGHFWRTWFCKDRFCPVCQWKRARIAYNSLFHSMFEMSKQGRRFISITVTLQSRPYEPLKPLLKMLSQAYTKMFADPGHALFRHSITGTFRSLEVTYNQQKHSWHPHLHIIAAVVPDYFDIKKDLYISYEKLSHEWNKLFPDRDAYEVWISAIDPPKQCIYDLDQISSLNDSVAEACKYVTKISDILFVEDPDLKLRLFDELRVSLAHVPGWRFSGDLKQFRLDLSRYEKFDCLVELEDDLHFIQLADGHRVRIPSSAIHYPGARCYSWSVDRYKINDSASYHSTEYWSAPDLAVEGLYHPDFDPIKLDAVTTDPDQYQRIYDPVIDPDNWITPRFSWPFMIPGYDPEA